MKGKHWIRLSEKNFTLDKNEFNGWSYINTLENVKTWPKNTNKAQL